MALLVGRRRGELNDAHVPGVDLRDQALDRAALARRIPALEDDANRRAERLLADLPAARHQHDENLRARQLHELDLPEAGLIGRRLEGERYVPRHTGHHVRQRREDVVEQQRMPRRASQMGFDRGGGP